METISARELDWYVNNHALVIDLRAPEYYVTAHIRGAVNVPYGQFEKGQLKTGKGPIILYCERGALSMAVARKLEIKGYKTRSVVGGIRAYRGENLVRGGNT